MSRKKVIEISPHNVHAADGIGRDARHGTRACFAYGHTLLGLLLRGACFAVHDRQHRDLVALAVVRCRLVCADAESVLANRIPRLSTTEQMARTTSILGAAH